MTRIICDYDGTTFEVDADFNQASSPIYIDGESIGRQVADARHRYDIAVAIAANHVFHLGLPEAPIGTTPDDWLEEISDNDEWDKISYRCD